MLWVRDDLQAFASSSTPTTTRRVTCTGFCDGGEVIVDLLENEEVSIAKRKKAIRNAKARIVRKILNVAAEHYTALCELWSSVHEKS